jgi:PAS domain S-box-containing protein
VADDEGCRRGTILAALLDHHPLGIEHRRDRPGHPDPAHRALSATGVPARRRRGQVGEPTGRAIMGRMKAVTGKLEALLEDMGAKLDRLAAADADLPEGGRVSVAPELAGHGATSAQVATRDRAAPSSIHVRLDELRTQCASAKGLIALHALEVSETRYRRLFEAAKDGILILDADSGMIADVNPFLMELTGYSREEFLGARLWEIGPFKDTADSKEAFAKLLTDKYVRYDNLPLQARDGRKIPVEFVSNVYLVDGQSVIQCNIRDITERKHAEAKLYESEQEFRTLAEAMPQIVWTTRPDGMNTYFNQQWIDYTGLTQEESRGHGWNIPFHPDDRERAALAWQRATQHNDTYSLECRLRRFDGAYRWWLVRGVPLRNASGEITKWFGTCTDIEDIKRGEEVLREQEKNYRTLFNSAGDAIFIREPSGRFLDANDVACERLGYSRDELLAMTPRGLDDPADGVTMDQRTEVVQRDGKSIFQVTHLARDGRRIPTEICSRLICYQGKQAILSIGRDITERKRAEDARVKLEDQLRASQKMEAIGSLAGGVAHDFNNLLSVILSFTGFALEGVREDDPQRADLLEVKNAADRAVGLTRQLLAFGRKQVLQPASLDLNQIAQGVEKMLRRILGEDIDFVQVLAPDLGIVKADPGQVEQVLMNLVVNARDAMPGGGKLTIETSNVEVDDEYATAHVAVKPGSYVQVAVTDTGCGMDKQTQARIFEPFFTTKERGKGTGLGLSTAYGVVKQSGGSIWVYSEPGRGTTFKVYLPRESSATTATALQPSAVSTRPTGTETILVVEDEEGLRTVARRGLEGAGYRVLTAADGPQALLVSAAHAGEIHLLVTDVVMPGMSGRAVAQELSRTRPTLKVVYMSGYTDDAIVHHGVLDAGTHFLAKPFTSADLTRKTREVLDAPAHPQVPGLGEV